MRRRNFCKLITAAALTSPLSPVLGRHSESDIAEASDAGPAVVSSGGSHTVAALSKVRVHPGWKGLVKADNKPFIPFGAMYFRPNTGWPPRAWKDFDAAATRRDLMLLKAHNFNTIRVWLTSNAFYPQPGRLDPVALAKFDQLLALAEEAGIHVQACALMAFYNIPAWQRTDRFADPQALDDQEQFWSLFASRYKGRNVILTYELANEPTIGWDTAAMATLWNKWNHKTTPIPSPKGNPDHAALLAFQLFREHVADEWTRRQVAAIKKADPDALVTIGLIQWSIPAIPNPLTFYSGFRPQRQAKFIDLMEIHFYPLAAGGYHYQSQASQLANLAYLESVVREAGLPGLPTVLAEFGWYGGGICPHYGPPKPGTPQQQAAFCSQEVRTSTPLVCGWLNWAMFDDPVAQDVTRFSGLFTTEGKAKAWGQRFGQIASEYQHQLPPVPLGKIGPRPDMPWNECLTSSAAAEKYRIEYLEAFRREHFRS